ncbi:MAG: hypothetical protein RKP46_11035 [Candidatus Accumulibacter sp.]|uniref:hypothetical protein n=1 Tax=Accumulibacter sp. TaxID=2053492 RepID=UPI002879215F|nr:hypothetical protein [Accumulibacter sp.]MDS4014869.1 hypothetical protein [Accumulibacter sp.]
MLKYRAVFVLVLVACLFAGNLVGRAFDGIDRRSPDYVPLTAGFDSLPFLRIGVTALNFVTLGFLDRSQHRQALVFAGRADAARHSRADWTDLALSTFAVAMLVVLSRWLARRLVPIR